MSRGDTVSYEAGVNEMLDVSFHGDKAMPHAQAAVAEDMARLIMRKGITADTLVTLEGDRITPMSDIADAIVQRLNSSGRNTTIIHDVARIACVGGEYMPVRPVSGRNVMILGAMASNDAPHAVERRSVQALRRSLTDGSNTEVMYCTVGEDAGWRPGTSLGSYETLTLYGDKHNRWPAAPAAMSGSFELLGPDDATTEMTGATRGDFRAAA